MIWAISRHLSDGADLTACTQRTEYKLLLLFKSKLVNLVDAFIFCVSDLIFG